MRVNYVVFRELEEFIGKDSNNFNILSILKSTGRADDMKYHNTGFMIACPFHEDSNPSLGYNTDINRWHCFSCDRRGSKFKLMKQVLSPDSTDISFMTHLLKTYPVLSELIRGKSLIQRGGGSSLIDKETKLREGVLLNKVNVKSSGLLGYVDLFRELKRRGVAEVDLKFAVLSMQDDVPPKLIYDTILGGSNEGADGAVSFNLEELIQSD